MRNPKLGRAQIKFTVSASGSVIEFRDESSVIALFSYKPTDKIEEMEFAGLASTIRQLSVSRSFFSAQDKESATRVMRGAESIGCTFLPGYISIGFRSADHASTGGVSSLGIDSNAEVAKPGRVHFNGGK